MSFRLSHWHRLLCQAPRGHLATCSCDDLFWSRLQKKISEVQSSALFLPLYPPFLSGVIGVAVTLRETPTQQEAAFGRLCVCGSQTVSSC